MKNSQSDESALLSNTSLKWGQIKLDKLPKEFDTARLKQEKPILIDQPLLPPMLSPDLGTGPYSSSKSRSKKQHEDMIPVKKSSIPRIDTYIINTIKLNQILKNRVPFDQVEMFKKSPPSQNRPTKPKSKAKNRPKRASFVIESNEQVRLYLKHFVTIMCLHVDFNEVSSMALDILIDLLDHFLESFFKLMKNLKNVYLADLEDPKSAALANVDPNYYNSEIYIEQALQELGLGSIKSLKDYYLNDIVVYYRSTYDKVNKMYEAYKKNRLRQFEGGGTGGEGDHNKTVDSNVDMDQGENSHADLDMDEFMKNNELLNDESNLILGEFLNDLSSSHLDEEMSKLLQMIGPDPFSLIPDNT